MKKNKIFLRLSVGLIAMILVLGFVLSAVFLNNARAVSPVRVKSYAANTSARAMCTLEMTSGRVLYSKNSEARLPMASTTKIITAIAAIENIADLDAKIKINDKAVGIEGTSIYLQKGEELTARELLLGLMLRSGNDAAMALAFAAAPTVEDFCGKMKAIAEKCGAMDSNFKNPHGLDEEGHYTTAKDLALITAYALKNPTFAEIVKTREAKISGKEYPRLLQNKNRLLRQLDGCIGVKTGFTKKAGRCFVGARNANGMTTVCVVLNCGPMFEECAELLRSAGEEYSMQKLVAMDEFIKFTDEKCEDKLCAISRQDFYYPLADEEIDDVEITLDGNDCCIAFKKNVIFRAECNKLES